MAELERDPAYRERQAALKAEEEQQTSALAEAEKPVLADLAAIGIRTDSCWNLYQQPGSLPEAIPVLLDHLEREYPDRVLEGIANALDDTSARDSWNEMKTIYLSTSKAAVRDRLAAAMAGIAVRAHYDDLLDFLAQESLGETRIYFLRPVHRIGNRMSVGKGRHVIEGLVDDPVLSTEAKRILAGRSRTD